MIIYSISQTYITSTFTFTFHVHFAANTCVRVSRTFHAGLLLVMEYYTLNIVCISLLVLLIK